MDPVKQNLVLFYDFTNLTNLKFQPLFFKPLDFWNKISEVSTTVPSQKIVELPSPTLVNLLWLSLKVDYLSRSTLYFSLRLCFEVDYVTRSTMYCESTVLLSTFLIIIRDWHFLDDIAKQGIPLNLSIHFYYVTIFIWSKGFVMHVFIR